MSDKGERRYLDSVPRELQDLIYEGRKIPAIKLAREKMGWGLKEAKDRVEATEAEMRARFPDTMPAPRAAGCGSAVLAGALILALATGLAIAAAH